MPNFGYHFSRLEGKWLRKVYALFLPWIARSSIKPPRSIALSVFAYSGEEMVPEQIRSIRSFLRNVGRPDSFTVVSDGSHTDRSTQLLECIDPVVSVRPSGEGLPDDLPTRFRHYVTTYPMGRQLGLLLSVPRNGPALYVDSDVLFFPGASDLVRYASTRDVPAFYLEDCKISADERIFRDSREAQNPVNCGLLMFFKKLDWSLGLARFLELEGEPNFFTNQTIAHLVFHANGAQRFDPARYVVQLDDQFVYPDRYAARELAIRHYVNPVRHKFWTSLLRFR